MLVSKDLHLDVTRTENKLFQVNVAVAKRRKSSFFAAMNWDSRSAGSCTSRMPYRRRQQMP